MYHQVVILHCPSGFVQYEHGTKRFISYVSQSVITHNPLSMLNVEAIEKRAINTIKVVTGKNWRGDGKTLKRQ